MSATPPARKRWGVRTLAYLVVSAGSIITANLLHNVGNDDYVLLTLLGTWVGLVGAAVCTVRSVRSWRGSLKT